MLNCTTAVILAGGKSSRMTYNKEFVKDNDTYLVHKTIELLKEKFEEVIVVTNHPELYKDVVILQDEEKNRGPLAGLSVALQYAKSDYIYLMAVDMPNLDFEYMNSLMQLEPGHQVYAADNGYIQTFHAIYHKSLLAEIPKHNSLYRLVKAVDAHVVDFQHLSSKLTGVDLFFNINDKQDLEEYEVKLLSKKILIDKYVQGTFETITDEVVEEFPITIYLNDQKYVTMLCTPESIQELVIGHLNADGLIQSMEEVLDYKIKEHRVDVQLKDVLITPKEQILYTACGVGTDILERLDELMLDSLVNTESISPGEISSLTTKLAQSSNLFMNTGGVHSALYKSNEVEVYKEDIGRHNAVDKIVGHMMIHKLSNQGVIVVSGRLSSDMVLKALMAKIPIVISRSAPTTLAVKLADKFGITLIGFARRDKMNVYTHKYRVKQEVWDESLRD